MKSLLSLIAIGSNTPGFCPSEVLRMPRVVIPAKAEHEVKLYRYPEK